MEGLSGQAGNNWFGIRFFDASWGCFGGPLGAVLALGSPSWGVLGRLGALLNRLKIDVKIDQKIDAKMPTHVDLLIPSYTIMFYFGL